MDDNTKNDIIDDVQAKATCKDNPTQLNPKGDESCKCAGGYGAIECSCGGSIASVSWSEQVSCGEKICMLHRFMIIFRSMQKY